MQSKLHKNLSYCLIGLVLLCYLFNGGNASFVTQGVMITTVVLALCAIPLIKFDLGSKTLVPIALIVLYATMQLITARVTYAATQDVALLFCYMVFAIAVTIVRPNKETILRVISILTLVAAGTGILQYITASSWIPSIMGNYDSPMKDRSSAMFFNPNYLGVISAIGSIILFVQSVGAQQLNKRAIITLCVTIAGIAVSGSRGSILAFVVAITVTSLLLARDRTLRKTLAIYCIIAVAWLGIASLIHGNAFKRSATNLNTAGVSSQQIATKNVGESLRLACWKGAISLWKTSPIVGVGPRMFDLRWHEVQPEAVQGVAVRVHNLWLQTLTEYGLCGLVLLLALILPLLFQKPASTTQIAIIGWVIVQLCYETFDFSCYTPLFGLLLVTGLALLSKPVEITKCKAHQYTNQIVLVLMLPVSIWLLKYAVLDIGKTAALKAAQTTNDKAVFTKEINKAFKYQPGANDVHLLYCKFLVNMELRKKQPNREWTPVLNAINLLLEINPYTIEGHYLAAIVDEQLKKGAGTKEIQLLSKQAPNSCKAAALIYKYYSGCSLTNEATIWKNRMDHLLEYKSENFFEPASSSL